MQYTSQTIYALNSDMPHRPPELTARVLLVVMNNSFAVAKKFSRPRLAASPAGSASLRPAQAD